MRYVNLFLNLALMSTTGLLQAQQPMDTAKYRIVVIGSSTAAGAGASSPDSAWVGRYRAWLQTLHPENEVLNLALGGYSTYQLLPSNLFPPKYKPRPDTLRNITKALLLRPDAVIINLPSNDAASGYTLEEQLANFDKIVRKATCAGVPVWVCTTQPRNFSADKILIQLLARHALLEKFGRQAIDVWEGLSEPNGLLDPRFNSGDGTHLNDEGHRVVFETVRTANIPGILGTLPKRSWIVRWWRWIWI